MNWPKLPAMKFISIILSIIIAGVHCSPVGSSFVGQNKAVDPYHISVTKSQVYSNGAVASAHPLASAIGAEILRQGGNAFDAAIAVQLALAVVYPGAGNIGGGGFMVAKTAAGQTIALDYRETAPASATRDMYLEPNGATRIELAQSGHLASGVPGTIAGLFASMTYAKLSFKQLIQPAIDLAAFGFVLTPAEANKLNTTRDAFIKNSTVTPVFVRQGKWKAGDTLVQKDLANTLTRIRDKGLAGFYEGETADLIVAEMQRGKGIITKNDLKGYQAKMREPIQFMYKGHTILSMPPPSSGGILLVQMLKMVESRPLALYGYNNLSGVQLMVEAERRAFADRAEHMGDPDYWKVPLKTLTSDNYITQRMADYDSTKAGKSSTIKAGMIKESTETTHISVLDKQGNMVSVTTTLNGNFGSRTVVGGAGFLMNNEMDDFSLKPGVPNMYGAVGGEANAIAPGKRMLSSMTPTLVLKDNQPFMVVGTPGGTTIPTSVFQTIINVIDFKMNAADALAGPRFHHQWLPDEVMIEETFPAAVVSRLQSMGYTTRVYGIPGYASTIGRVELIKVTNGKLEAAADPRGDDSVAGY